MDLSSLTADSSFPVADRSLSAPAQEDWLQIQLLQSKWFPKLRILIFGLALALAADLLYNFPLGSVNRNGWNMTDINDYSDAISSEYAILLTLIAVILLTFTFICLTLRLKKLDRPSWVQEILWICLIVILVVGFLLFDWYMFDRFKATLLTMGLLLSI